MPVAVTLMTSPADLDSVLEIEAASFTNPWTREMYVAEMSNRDSAHILIARDEAGHAVGFCSYWIVLDELHVNNLAVLPEQRRTGIGSALLVRLLSEAEARGVRQIFLEVRRSNGPATALYERFGFALVGTRPGYYTQPAEDALVLSRSVDSSAGA